MIQINSYRDLSIIGQYIESLKGAPLSQVIDQVDWEFYKIALGLVLLNRVGGLDQFNSNRYFQDSLNVKVLPSNEALNIFLKDTNKLRNISKNLLKSHLTNINFSLNIDLNEATLEDVAKLLIEHLDASSQLSSIVSRKSLFGDKEATFFENNGYLIIENFIDPIIIDATRELIFDLAKKEAVDQQAYFYGKNDLLQRVYNLLNKDLRFHKFIDDPRVFGIMNQIFNRDTLHDKFLLSSFHANILNPGGEEQIIHVDSAVPNPLPAWIVRANINFLLEDYTADNGATLVIPGSHKFLTKPAKSDQNSPNLIKLIAPKGSIVIWTGHIWHKSGTNNSVNPRVALLACFASSFLKEMVNEEDYAYLLSDKVKHSISDNLKSLIGLNYGVKKGSIY